MLCILLCQYYNKTIPQLYALKGHLSFMTFKPFDVSIFIIGWNLMVFKVISFFKIKISCDDFKTMTIPIGRSHIKIFLCGRTKTTRIFKHISQILFFLICNSSIKNRSSSPIFRCTQSHFMLTYLSFLTPS